MKRVVFSFLVATAIVACSSLKDGGTPATNNEGGGGNDDGSVTGDAPNNDLGDATADTGVVKGNGDPRFPQGPVPADAPTTASYTIMNSPDGALVTDLVTGLVWQDSVPTPVQKQSQTLSAAYCESLSYGGLTGWRLPTRLEAISILDIRTTFGDSSVTTSAFSDVPDYQCFWTASTQDTSGWAANAAGLELYGADTHCAARCVQGPPIPKTPILPVYDLSDLNAVHDPVTGLYWERNVPSDEMTTDDEGPRCAKLMIHGQAARLPTVKELASITDETKSNPANAGAFGGISDEFFTSNPEWAVHFDTGYVTQGPTQGFMHYARCVVGP